MTGAIDQLGDPHAARDRERFAAEIDKQHLYLAAVVGIDRAGRVEHGDAVARGKPGARPHLRFVPCGSAMAMPVGTSARAPGAMVSGASGRHRGQQIEAGGGALW